MRKKYLIRWELEGKRVPASTQGATKRRDFVGYVQKIAGKEVMLGRVAETARAVLAEKLRDSELKRRGIMPEIAGAEKPIEEAINGFISSLEAKERSPKHVTGFRQKLEKVAHECCWNRTSDAKLEELEGWIARKRREDAPGAARFSTATGNHFRAAWRAWGNWLVKTGRALYSPFRGVEKTNTETDRRHVRRALTPEEVEFLLERAEAGPPRGKMPGANRAMLYRVAVSTGLRARELSSLTPSSFNLEASTPHLELPAKFAKARRKALQPIPRALVPCLEAFLSKQPKNAPVWPATMSGQNKLGKILRADCAMARGEHPSPPAGFLESRPGAVIDFHALRGTFLTALASKVSASTLGALGRHASVQTTEKHYVNHRLASLGESLDDANLFWFSNGSPGERKSTKRGESKVNRAAALVERFMTTLKPLELKDFSAKIGRIIGAQKSIKLEVEK